MLKQAVAAMLAAAEGDGYRSPGSTPASSASVSLSDKGEVTSSTRANDAMTVSTDVSSSESRDSAISSPPLRSGIATRKRARDPVQRGWNAGTTSVEERERPERATRRGTYF